MCSFVQQRLNGQTAVAVQLNQLACGCTQDFCTIGRAKVVLNLGFGNVKERSKTRSNSLAKLVHSRVFADKLQRTLHVTFFKQRNHVAVQRKAFGLNTAQVVTVFFFRPQCVSCIFNSATLCANCSVLHVRLLTAFGRRCHQTAWRCRLLARNLPTALCRNRLLALGQCAFEVFDLLFQRGFVLRRGLA